MLAPAPCPECGAPLPSDAPLGVCPRCVLMLGLDGGGPTIDRDGRAAPPAAPVGLPNLELSGPIGQGGMGVVYRARQVKLDRPVAVKVIRPGAATDPAAAARFAERFAREARAMARLNHPNILTVHDFGESDGLCYLVMELVEGPDLRRRLAGGRLPVAEAVAVAVQACRALEFAHERGVIHRDIKPENVLLDAAGTVKIADFGLAKLVQPDTADPSLTATRQVVGTPQYMAPEQLERPREVDHRADVYALGVLLYEMLTGTLPAGRFDLPSEAVAVDPAIDAIVERALRREPDRRQPTVAALRSELEAFARDHCAEGVAAGPSRPLAPGDDEDRDDEDEDGGWISPTAMAGAALIAVGGFMAIDWAIDHLDVSIPKGFALMAVLGLAMAFIQWQHRREAMADKPAPTSPDRRARRAVRLAAAGLMVAGPAQIVFGGGMAFLLFSGMGRPGSFVYQTFDPALGAAIGVLCVVGALFGVVVAVGGALTWGFHARRLALASAVLALFSPGASLVIGLPVGLYALIVLMRPEVRRLFDLPPATPDDPAPPKPVGPRASAIRGEPPAF